MIEKNVVLKSLFWKFLERMGTQGAQFVISVVLARLLSPTDFGLIALITIFITIANVFIQSGLNTALIQKKNSDNLDFSSVFFASLVLALSLYILLFCLSPCIAGFYDRPELVPVVRVLSLTLIVGALNSVQEAYVSKNMMFKKLFYRSVCAIIPAGLVGVLLAYKGFGVWSLVAQQLTNVTLMCVLMWFTVKWRPQLQFSFSRLKELFSYGWKLLVSTLLDVGYGNLHSLIVGKLFPPSVLGFYSRGNQFPSLLITNVNSSIQSVLLPSMSSVQDDQDCVKRMVRRAVMTSSFIIVPLMAGLAALAKPLVLVVLGEKWLPCVPFVQIYCFTYAFWPIHTSNLSAIKALGRSDIFLKLEILKKIIGTVVLVVFICFFCTPIGIASTGLITAVTSSFLNAHPNKKLLNYGYLEQMKDVLPSFALSLVMGGGLVYLLQFEMSPWLQLFLFFFIGASFYFGGAKLFRFESLDYMLKSMRNFNYGNKGNK